ncbi:hypothetical protein COM03_27225 [Bacillus wiedmannii]|uniref:hypothetical protein n=1 Tax=Bacillus wiedmannii TaxID=1890302 RepID=UPI000BFA2300|nr:hypothetical protein [Bacillus wiedmannii]PGB73538.1 hypothetical protein COM03_27225 [Bacillus wiedmannii]
MELWHSFMSLEVKDKLNLIGLVITFTVSSITLWNTRRISKKTGFLNSITKERVESMGELKEQISKYLSLIQKFPLEILKDEKERVEFVRAIEYRKNKIDFQLNDDREFEKKIIENLETTNSVIKLLIQTEESETINIHVELGRYNLSIDKLRITNVITNPNMNYNQFCDTLNDSLDRLNKLLIISFKKHLKNEWEKIKKEAK